MSWQSQVLVAGDAKGDVLRLDAGLSFWGGVDQNTSQITQARHPQCGQTLAGKLVVMPELIGSSSSSAILLELIYNKRAPAALILGQMDAILPIGGVVAEQMGWESCPIVVMQDPVFKTGEQLTLHRSGLIERVIPPCE